MAQDGMDINFDQVPTVHFPDGQHIVSAYPAFEDYMYMFFDICDAMGFSVENECQIYPMNADIGGNALATVLDGNRVIVYDRKLSAIVGAEGAEMIIAHELGHHECHHLGTRIDPHKELVADAFAGATMKLMGMSLEAALGEMKQALGHVIILTREGENAICHGEEPDGDLVSVLAANGVFGCGSISGDFSMSLSNLRYKEFHTTGYLGGPDAESDTPNVTIGECKKVE